MQTATAHPAGAVGRVTIALALLCAAILGGAPGAMAVPSPENFELRRNYLEVISSNPNVKFEGDARLYLYTSNTDADQVRARVGGQITLTSAGCAQLRVVYLDGNGADVAAEHSQMLIKPSGGPTVRTTVREHSFHHSYRDVRVELLHGSTCSNLQEVGNGDKSDLNLQMTTLGDGERWVTGVKKASSAISHYNATAANIEVRWDIATNPAPTPDRGDVQIKAKLNYWNAFSTGCARLHARYKTAGGSTIASSQSDLICSGNPTKITMPNFASNADLHSVDLRVESYANGISEWSPRKYFYLN